MVVPYTRTGTRDRSVIGIALQVLLLALIPLCFFKVKSHYDGPPLSAKHFDLGLIQDTRTAASTEALDEASKSFGRAFNKLDPDATFLDCKIK